MPPVVQVVRFVNLVSGSLMLGGFMFGAVTVARAHVRMPPHDAWRIHRFISRRVDWFIPASTFAAMLSGWILLAIDDVLVREAYALTFVGAVLLTSYGLPFTFHRTGLRNELVFVRSTADEVGTTDAVQRMRWWNRWHYFRTAVGGAAHGCYLLATLWR
jgi:hypothetical protein